MLIDKGRLKEGEESSAKIDACLIRRGEWRRRELKVWKRGIGIEDERG